MVCVDVEDRDPGVLRVTCWKEGCVVAFNSSADANADISEVARLLFTFGDLESDLDAYGTDDPHTEIPV